MEVYKLEFNFFCGVGWTNKTVIITSLNKKDIKKVFFDELKHASERELPEDKWKRYESKIEHCILKFPLITYETW